MSFRPSKSSKAKPKKSRAGVALAPKLNITSLVDVLTVLLVFLIQNFSSSGDIITPAKGLKIPLSTSKKAPIPALAIGVAIEHILAEGKPVDRVEDVIGSENNYIPGLGAFLLAKRANIEKMASYSTTVEFKGNIIIHGDRKIPYKLLQKVIFTCGNEGFSNISLVVRQKE